MYKHQASRTRLVLAISALVSLAPQLAAAKKCTDAPNPHAGPHSFYCADVSTPKEHSFCLRPDSANPKHVRQLKDYDALVTESFVMIDKFTQPKAPDPCTGVSIPTKLAEGDIVRIVKQNSDYVMQIWTKAGAPRFPGPVTLTKAAAPNGDIFYLTTEQDNVDYFVMLADDDEGQPGAADVPRIEKYLEIELFPKRDKSHEACDKARPDEVSGNTLANFKRWTTGDPSCSVQQLQEAGTGSGGSNFP
jgi:hypothetical protein